MNDVLELKLNLIYLWYRFRKFAAYIAEHVICNVDEDDATSTVVCSSDNNRSQLNDFNQQHWL